MAKASVTLYFPSAADDRLEAETREIVDTKRPADRGAQILTALLEGPQSNAALPAVPPGTTLRRLWVREDGNAYADFSEELASGLTGGSADELLTVYAIVDSLTSNVPSIRRVGILVAGRERETLGGHVDVRRPLLPNSSLAPQAKAAP
jgi:spore germination protein GerM